jgi:GTP-binding protein
MGAGEAIPFALDALQDRGRFFVEGGNKLYTGQVIGEHAKEGDLLVNAQKSKKLTNMRAAASDRGLKVAPALKMSLEECLEYLNPDEYVEITPKTIRLRKSVLGENDRRRAEKDGRATEA